jgi:hypothetical protein
MITAGIVNGKVALTQSNVSPSVYLDHWALLGISQDKALAQRLLTALQRRSGTLVLSWMNLSEFIKVGNAARVTHAEELVQQALPHVFFMEVDPFRVIDREDRPGSDMGSQPHADMELLKVFATHNRTSLTVFSASGFFMAVRKSQLASGSDRLADVFLQKVEDARTSSDRDPQWRDAIDRKPWAPEHGRSTLSLFREVVRGLIGDKKTKLNRNHAMDFYHALVPAVYCDFVLIDKYWEERLKQARRRYAKAQVAFPMAAAFSAKNQGVERFLAELEQPTATGLP